MPTLMRSDVKSITITTAPGFPQTSAPYRALPHGAVEYARAINRVRDRRYSKPLSLRTAILCVGVLNVIGWSAILASVIVLL